MDIFAFLLSFDWSIVVTFALSVMFVFTVVVFFHELGHYWVGRLCNVGVDAFSIGFGQEVIGYTDRHGTRWKLCWIPLGGYVKFFGDLNAASVPDQQSLKELSQEDQQKTLSAKPVFQRAAVVAAGPMASFLLAIFIFTGLFASFGKPVIAPVIGEVIENSPASEAGFQPGDRIISVNSQEISSFNELQFIIFTSSERPLDFSIERDNQLITIQATPRLQEAEDHFGHNQRVAQLGIRSDPNAQNTSIQKFNIFTAFIEGINNTGLIISRTLIYLWKIIVGELPADQVGGAVRLINVSGQIGSDSFIKLLHLTAFVSASIGLINLFPIPLLDGGHLLFYVIEAIRGKPLSEKAQDIGFRIGIITILTLFMFVTWNDIQSLFNF